MSKLIKLEKPACRPCLMVSSFLDDQNVQYEPIDVTVHPEVGAEYGVMSVPVTILLDDTGKEVSRSIGFNPVQLEELISKL